MALFSCIRWRGVCVRRLRRKLKSTITLSRAHTHTMHVRMHRKCSGCICDICLLSKLLQPRPSAVRVWMNGCSRAWKCENAFAARKAHLSRSPTSFGAVRNVWQCRELVCHLASERNICHLSGNSNNNKHALQV